LSRFAGGESLPTASGYQPKKLEVSWSQQWGWYRHVYYLQHGQDGVVREFRQLAGSKLGLDTHIGNVPWSTGPLSSVVQIFQWTEPIH
jgi:hypothetical protein